MNSPRVNFHCHSNYSDGILSIPEICIALANDSVEHFALTDHDSVEGTLEIAKHAKQFGITCYNGVELTVDLYDNCPEQFFHLLAYDFDYGSLKHALDTFNKQNSGKCTSFIKRLKKDGYKFEMAKRNPNRNYFKYIDIIFSLFMNGPAKSRSEAFQIVDKPEYEQYKEARLSKQEAIKMIHDANGIAIMAHPFDIFKDSQKVPTNEEEVEKIVHNLYELGIDGIEVYYKPYSQEKVEFLIKLAEKYNFIKSIGTDFHGRNSDSMWHQVETGENLLLEHLINRQQAKHC